MTDLSKIDIHLAIDGFTLRINGLDTDVDVHGPHKNEVFCRLLTSTAPFWKIRQGSHKGYMHLEGNISDLSAKAVKALEKIRTLSKIETEELMQMPLDEMSKKLIIKAFIEK